MQVQGIMGSLAPADVQQAMQAQMHGFLRCFQERVGELESLSGTLELAFRVRVSGRVRWVYPRYSNLGDRKTERCMIKAATTLRFPPPSGHGEAQFVYPMQLDLLEGVRAPEAIDAEALAPVVAKHGPKVLRACRPRGHSYALHLTAYVDARGEVVAAGASADARKADEALDCAVEAVRGWELPTRRRGVTKVEFALR
ncbi:MAG: AgmX/PglI C-terminal domain-containing protein [Polyangiales bacterium]